MKERLLALWYVPAPAARLALLRIAIGGFATFGVWMVRHPALFAPLAVATLLIELGGPLALAHRRVALAWTLGAWAFHIGVFVTMGITFAYPLSFVPFLPFFRVERVLPWLHALRRFATRIRFYRSTQAQ